jgi:hypothetical protein
MMAEVVMIHKDRQSFRRSRSQCVAVTDDFWTSPLDVLNDENTMVDVPPPTVMQVKAHPQFLLDDDNVDDDDNLLGELKGYDHTLLLKRSSHQKQRDCQLEDCAEPALLTPAHIILPQQTQQQQQQQQPQRKDQRPWLLRFALPNSSQTMKHTSEWEFLLSNDETTTDNTLPGLTPASLDDSSLDSSNSSNSSESDNCSISSTSSTKYSSKSSNCVSFVESVTVHYIPHSSSLSPTQRRRMYSSSNEVRVNKSRNKREYRYDGNDWRNVTEEWAMSVDMITGELIHPVHEVHDTHQWR